MGGQRRGGVEKGVCSVRQDSSGEQVSGPGSLHHSVQNTKKLKNLSSGLLSCEHLLPIKHRNNK
jgi:hypothetical protein